MDRWQQVSRLYHDARTRAEGERAAFLREACVGDDALRREVESLLAQEGSAEGFLSEAALEMAGKGLGISLGSRDWI
jgi:serine/threonine-protein kinase